MKHLYEDGRNVGIHAHKVSHILLPMQGRLDAYTELAATVHFASKYTERLKQKQIDQCYYTC